MAKLGIAKTPLSTKFDKFRKTEPKKIVLCVVPNSHLNQSVANLLPINLPPESATIPVDGTITISKDVNLHTGVPCFVIRQTLPSGLYSNVYLNDKSIPEFFSLVLNFFCLISIYSI
jgi:hypothetical protein